MIAWINAPGLAEKIRSQGCSLAEKLLHDNTRIYETDDDVAVQAIIDNYTLDDARDWLKTQLQPQINDAYERAITALYGSKPHDLESNGWRLKEIQARAWDEWNSGGKVGAEPSTSEIDPRVTVANPLVTEVAAIIAKADLLHSSEAAIQTNSQTIKEVINTAIDFDALNAIDLTAGWPA